jgi:CelD/BcsL family acetyltransferase involved in cellulose biosynthesis
MGARPLFEAMTVTALRDRRGLEALVPAWEELARAALEPNPFYEHWMLLPALDAFGAGQDVRVVLVWSGEKLAGLFPFQRVARFKRVPATTLTSWRHPHCMLGAPLVRADRAIECFSTLLRWLQAGDDGASILELSYLPVESPLHQAWIEALNQARLAAVTTQAYTRPLLCRGADAEEYLRASLSCEARGNFRRREKRLAELGTVAHVVLGQQDDVGRWIDDFLQLEASGWKGRNGSALACSETHRGFATEIFTRAFERKRLVMVGVDLNGKPIARYCGFIAGAGSFAFKTAYDEALRKIGPGLLAELDMIRAFHALPGVQWMDSFCARNDSTSEGLWRHRRTVQRVAVGANTWGELALAALPLLRWLKRRAIVPRWTGADGATLRPSARPKEVLSS